MFCRYFKCFLCVLMACCVVSVALAEGISLSATTDSPLAVISASSSENAAKAAFLLYLAQGSREGASMETCVVETLSDSVDNGVETLELYVLRITFGRHDGNPEISSGAYFVKLQLVDNSDGTYSLLSFFVPEEGDNLYAEVEEHFTVKSVEILMSRQDELMNEAQTEALAIWNQYRDQSPDMMGACTIMSSISPVEIQNSDNPNLQVGTLLTSVDANQILEYTVNGDSFIWIEFYTEQ